MSDHTNDGTQESEGIRVRSGGRCTGYKGKRNSNDREAFQCVEKKNGIPVFLAEHAKNIRRADISAPRFSNINPGNLADYITYRQRADEIAAYHNEECQVPHGENETLRKSAVFKMDGHNRGVSGSNPAYPSRLAHRCWLKPSEFFSSLAAETIHSGEIELIWNSLFVISGRVTAIYLPPNISLAFCVGRDELPQVLRRSRSYFGRQPDRSEIGSFHKMRNQFAIHSDPFGNFSKPLQRVALLRKMTPSSRVHQSDLKTSRRQPLIGVVVTQAKSIFCPTRKKPVRLIRPLGHKIVD